MKTYDREGDPAEFGRSNKVKIFGDKTSRQCGLLIGTQGFAIVLSFLFTMLITRALDVEAYGVFRYAMTFLGLAMTVLQFGWPYSAARLLALENEPSAQQEIVGACLIVLVISAVIGAIGTLGLLFIAEALGYHPPRILLWMSPFLHVTLGQYMIRNACQGLNRISLLSSQQVLPYLVLLPITALQIFIIGKYSLRAALIGYVAVFSVVIAIGFIHLGFSFGNWKSRLRAIGGENRQTGLPIYIGGVFGVASAQVISMLVAEFVDPARYGQYALALVVSAPLAVLISSAGTVVFRSSSTSQALTKKFLVYAFGLGGLLALLYLAATEYLLIRVFGSRYAQSVQMSQVLGIGSLMVGFGDIFQRFLGSQGKGKALCIAAISTGVVGIVSAVVLLPEWNAYGAIVSSVMSAATYFGLMIGMYIVHTTRRGQNRCERAGSGAVTSQVENP